MFQILYIFLLLYKMVILFFLCPHICVIPLRSKQTLFNSTFEFYLIISNFNILFFIIVEFSTSYYRIVNLTITTILNRTLTYSEKTFISPLWSPWIFHFKIFLILAYNNTCMPISFLTTSWRWQIINSLWVIFESRLKLFPLLVCQSKGYNRTLIFF